LFDAQAQFQALAVGQGQPAGQGVGRGAVVGVVDLPAVFDEAQRAPQVVVRDLRPAAGAAEQPGGQAGDRQALACDFLDQAVGVA